MIQRCLAILIKALSFVVGGSVDTQYLVGSFSFAATRPATTLPGVVPLARSPGEPGVL